MNHLPETIREGMDVFDNANEKIGSVESVRFGDDAAASGENPAGTCDDSLIDTLAEAIWPDDMPEAQRAVLLGGGYLVLDADGIFASDRYIQPEQITRVSADGVYLNVSREGLAKA